MNDIKTINNKLRMPLVISLIGFLILIISIFLPYLTAVGEMAEYIEAFPNVVVIDEQNVTVKDLENVSFISVSTLIESIWGEDDAQISDIFLIVFGVFALLTTVFVFFKKPIIAIICDLLTCGTFIFFSVLMKEDFVGTDKYEWGLGSLVTLIAIVIIFIGLVWMLISKIIYKRKQNIIEE